MRGHCVATTEGGSVRGTLAGRALAFHAIPYASPPLGNLRFWAPQPVVPWSGERDATKRGASAPQGPSRLDAVMGIVPFEQSEDCLTLTVWTPGLDGGKRPVMMWLHGGAYQSGGAHQVFYDGANLAASGDIVVVGVNYRLGAIGYLHLPEAEETGGVAANRGLLDQMAALRWIHRNIAAFGGDPDAITIAGQSAGGGSVYALLCDPASRALVRRAIPQSPSAGTLSLERASAIRARFYDFAKVDAGDIDALASLPIGEVIAAQRAVQMDIAATGDRTIAYQNVAGTSSVPRNPADSIAAGIAKDIPLLIGTTLDEGHAWLAQDEKLLAATAPGAALSTAHAGGYADGVADIPAGRISPAAKPWEAASAMMTWAVFEKHARRVAAGHAAHGGTAYVYRFDWRPTRDARFGACHCAELPFMLGNLEHWPACAMMQGHAPASYNALSQRMLSAWASFVCTGSPAVSSLPAWAGWNPTRRDVMLFDDTCRIETLASGA